MADGIRMADPRSRFEKHFTLPGKEGGAFTRPWGSQPMSANLKTGQLTGSPHPEPKLIYKEADEQAPVKKAKPTKDVVVKHAYGR